MANVLFFCRDGRMQQIMKLIQHASPTGPVETLFRIVARPFYAMYKNKSQTSFDYL